MLIGMDREMPRTPAALARLGAAVIHAEFEVLPGGAAT
jgi:hypothetical protein